MKLLVYSIHSCWWLLDTHSSDAMVPAGGGLRSLRRKFCGNDTYTREQGAAQGRALLTATRTVHFFRRWLEL